MIVGVPVHVICHRLGTPMNDNGYKIFLVSYRHEGAEWVLELKARDQRDAEARLARLAFATLDGELIARVPASAGPLAKLAVLIRNGFQRLVSGQV